MVRTLFLPESEENLKDCTVVIPCYKEDKKIVEKLVYDLLQEGFLVIVVDDGTTMPELEIPTLSYTPHKGYGYALKQGIKAAINPYILTMDSDGQHTVADAVKLYKIFKLIGDFDMVIGTRWNLNEDFKRWFGRKILNFIASCIAGHYLVDLNSGMRIFRRDLAVSYEHILCNTFSFTTSISMSFIADGYKAAYIPINVQPRANGKSHVKVIKHGFVTLYYIIRIGFAMRTRGIRKWLRNLRGVS